ncbi:MAG TPA: DUF484 family protein [Gammaproteobacteria bacterium]|nr:DUF484 family protein [Gammaproteobacteria bacterium]
MNKATIINKKANGDEVSTEQEQQLATDLELISLLRDNADILQRHPELLAVLEVPHVTGQAASLIERQVAILRQQTKTQDERLCALMDVARDNERLATSRHGLALNLLAAHDLDEVISTVLDVLSNELSADYAVIKLFSDEGERITQSPALFVDAGDKALSAFKIMLEQKNIVCGKSTSEQKTFLFGENAGSIKSAAVIPLVTGANLGLIGLGAEQAERFTASMGTDFLMQIGELVSASLAIHLEDRTTGE